MRAFLDILYRGCGVLAGAFIALIALSMIAEIVARLFGVIVPGALEVASFSLLASSFLALAHTLKHGEHIRVLVVLDRMVSPRYRPMFEIWSLVFSALLIAYLGVYVMGMAFESYSYGDQSLGVLSIPLWIPQAGMAAGILVLEVALVDEMIILFRGDEPTYNRATPAMLMQEIQEDENSSSTNRDTK